jgi:hypothetical protein
MPINCKENMIIIMPATILSEFEYSNNKFPINEAVAPKKIKTNENPSENKMVFNKTFFLCSTISLRLCPEI